MQLSGMALYTPVKGGRDDGTNTLAPKDVVCTVPKRHSGKIKTRVLPSPSHVSVCVRKTKEKKKSQIIEGFITFRTLFVSYL